MCTILFATSVEVARVILTRPNRLPGGPGEAPGTDGSFGNKARECGTSANTQKCTRETSFLSTMFAVSLIGVCSLCAFAVLRILLLMLPWRPNAKAQRVLRSGDMEYVMLHLIFSLPHAWDGDPRRSARGGGWRRTDHRI